MSESPEETPENPEKEPDKKENSYSEEDFQKQADLAKKAQQELDEFKKSHSSDKDKWLKEGMKRGQMSASEQAEAEFNDRKADLDKREANLKQMQDEIKQGQALSATKEALMDAGYPKEFANYLSDVDEDKRTENIKQFGSVFDKAVNDAVDKKLQGKHTPESGQSNPAGKSDTEYTAPKTRADFFNMPLKEQQAFMNDNPEAAQQFLN